MDKGKVILSILGCVGITSVGYFLYRLYEMYTHIELSEYIMEYFYEAEVKLANSSDKYSKDNTTFIINLFIALEEELFKFYYNDLDEERYSFLQKDLSKEYEQLLNTTLVLNQDTIKQANKMIENKLKISMTKIQGVYKSIDDKEELKHLMKKNRKQYTKLPIITKETLKEAYLYWCNLNVEREQIAYQLFSLASQNIQYENFSVQSFLFNKYYTKDKLYSKYLFHDKYFDDLLEFHELLDDPEIKTAYSKLENLVFQ